MLTKTEAIVLHSLKYGEQRIIVDMFTRQHGRMSFIVSVPKTSKGKLKVQYFQPLTLLEVECDVRPQAQLQKLRDARLLVPLSSLYTEPSKLSIAFFTAEFLYHALRGEQQGDSLFDYLRNSVEWLDGAVAHYANFHLVLLMRLSRFLGFYPDIRENGNDAARLFFDLRAASFCTTPPSHHDFLRPDEAGRIGLLMRMDYPTMHLFRLSRTERGRILEILLLYYRLHLPDFPELRSVSVLRELVEA